MYPFHLASYMLGKRSSSGLVAILLVTVFAGCISDTADVVNDDASVADYMVFPPPETVDGLEVLATLELGNVNEVHLRGGYAYLSGYSGSFIVDIRDPAEPVLVEQIPCQGIHVRTIQLEDRLLMTLSSQSNDNCPDAAASGGVRLVDVTDPADPIIGPQVSLTFGSHTHTPYGDTGIIYNSAYNLYTNVASHGQIYQHQRSEIIDVNDWDDPKVVDEFIFPDESTSLGCHDIYPEPERDRAICAAITETQIWDTTDPRAPSVVSIIRNPLLSIHHTAATNNDGTILILGDEWTGAAGPGCFDGGTAPIGALWFYDISNQLNPVELSYFAPPHQGPDMPCTAHNFNVIEDHEVLVAAFFKGGTVLVDFSDPSDPVMIQKLTPSGTDVWAAYYHNGHVFTGDRGRGLDVLMFAGHDHDDHAHEGILERIGGLLPF